MTKEVKQIRVVNKSFFVRECPFCGKTDSLVIQDSSDFQKLIAQHGKAALSLTCERCNIDFWEHTHSINDYTSRLQLMLNKWNVRNGESDESTYQILQ